MCKFHNDAIESIIKDPVTNDMDPIKLALMKCAMAGQRISQFLPTHPNVSGGSSYELAASDTFAAFVESPLLQRYSQSNEENNDISSFLNRALDQVIEENELNQANLNLPATIKGHRRKLIKFVDDVTEDLYIDFITPQRLPLKPGVKNQTNEPLRAATEKLLQKPGVPEALEQSFINSVSRNFVEAQEKVSPFWLNIYEKTVPKKLREYSYCAEGACASGGGVLAGHVGCLVQAAFIPTMSASTSTIDSKGVMYGMMYGLSAVGLGLYEYLNWKRDMYATKVQNFITYGTAIVGLTGLTLYHELSHNHGDMTHDHKTEQLDQYGRPNMDDAILCAPPSYYKKQDSIRKANSDTTYTMK